MHRLPWTWACAWAWAGHHHRETRTALRALSHAGPRCHETFTFGSHLAQVSYSTSAAHIAEAMRVASGDGDWTLSDAEMRALTAVDLRGTASD